MCRPALSLRLPVYKCNCDVCSPGWTGSRCETDIDECADQPCLYGYQCINVTVMFALQAGLVVGVRLILMSVRTSPVSTVTSV